MVMIEINHAGLTTAKPEMSQLVLPRDHYPLHAFQIAQNFQRAISLDLVNWTDRDTLAAL